MHWGIELAHVRSRFFCAGAVKYFHFCYNNRNNSFRKWLRAEKQLSFYTLFLFREKKGSIVVCSCVCRCGIFFALTRNSWIHWLYVIFVFTEVTKWESVFLWENKCWFAYIISILNQTEAVELNHQNFLLKFHLSKSTGLNLEPVADSVRRLFNASGGLGCFFSIISWDMYACV